MDNGERRILGFTSACHFFTHFTMLLFPPLATTIAKDFGLGLAPIFSMSFVMYLLYGLGAIPWGYLADRWNPRMVLASGIAITSVGLIGSGLLHNPRLLPFSLAVVGLGNAAYHPSGLALISKGMRTRGKSMGINGVFGNLGIALAPLSAGLLGWTLGWRWVFLVFGVMGLIAGAVIIAVPFHVARAEDKQQGQSVKHTRALVFFAILCGAVLFSGLMYRSFTLILPSWIEGRMAAGHLRNLAFLDGLKDRSLSGMGATGLTAALFSGAAMIIGMGGQLAGGRLADRMELRKAYLMQFGLALPSLVMAILFKGWLSLPFLGLFTFFALGIQPIENSLYAMLTPPQWRSSGFGIKFTLAFGVGSLAVRIVSNREPIMGLEGLMYLTAIYLVCTVLIGFILLSFGRKEVIRHLHAPSEPVSRAAP